MGVDHQTKRWEERRNLRKLGLIKINAELMQRSQLPNELSSSNGGNDGREIAYCRFMAAAL